MQRLSFKNDWEGGQQMSFTKLFSGIAAFFRGLFGRSKTKKRKDEDPYIYPLY